jgi:hypothetical protein
MKDFRVELKVCEGCGALWLRAADRGAYCRGCTLRLADLPMQRVRTSKEQRVTKVRAMACAGGAR